MPPCSLRRLALSWSQVMSEVLDAAAVQALYTNGPDSALSSHPSALLAYFKVDQADGCGDGMVFRDYSGNNHHATLFNGVSCVRL